MNIKSQEKTQGDLFEQVQTADKKIRKKTRLLLPDVKNSTVISYETAIFYIIGFVMACIITFSLGVEKGRYDEKKKHMVILQPELKKGVSNVAAPKPKNIKSR
jgi:hypothetical protein